MLQRLARFDISLRSDGTGAASSPSSSSSSSSFPIGSDAIVSTSTTVWGALRGNSKFKTSLQPPPRPPRPLSLLQTPIFDRFIHVMPPQRVLEVPTASTRLGSVSTQYIDVSEARVDVKERSSEHKSGMPYLDDDDLAEATATMCHDNSTSGRPAKSDDRRVTAGTAANNQEVAEGGYEAEKDGIGTGQDRSEGDVYDFDARSLALLRVLLRTGKVDDSSIGDLTSAQLAVDRLRRLSSRPSRLGPFAGSPTGSSMNSNGTLTQQRSSISSSTPSNRSRGSRTSASSFQSFGTVASSAPSYDTPGTSPGSSPRSSKSFYRNSHSPGDGNLPGDAYLFPSTTSAGSAASRRSSAPPTTSTGAGGINASSRHTRPSLVPRPPKMQTDFFGLDLSFLQDEPPPRRSSSGTYYGSAGVGSQRPGAVRRTSDLGFGTSDEHASSRRPSITLPTHRASVNSTGLTFPNASRPFPTRKTRVQSDVGVTSKHRSPSTASLNAFGRLGRSTSPSPSHFSDSSPESEEDDSPCAGVDASSESRTQLAAYFDSAAEAMEGGKSLSMAREDLRSGTLSRRASRDHAAIEAEEAQRVAENKAKMAEKRRRTIKELCETERTYASDMAVVRDIFLTRARGAEMSAIAEHVMASGLGLACIGEEESPSFSSRSRISGGSRQGSLVTCSVSSRIERRRKVQITQPLEYVEDPVLSSKDIHIVFANLEEIADLAEAFAGVLDGARGSDDEEQMDDTIGDVFVEMLPRIEQVYSTYCARHHRAIVRLQELEPSLRTYFSECRALSHGRTSAWDLASLLIKPVQRCLKYPLLLEQILAATPADHPDRADLVLANKNMLIVAENINEYKKRADTVERSLASKRGSTSSHVRDTSFSLSKKLLRSGTKVKNAPGMDSGDRDEMFDTLAALVETTRSGVMRFSTEMKDWSRTTKGALEAQVTMVSGWIDLYAPIGDETAAHPSHRRLEVFVDDVLVPLIEGPYRELDYEIRHSLLSKTDHLLSLFDNPRQVIQKRNESKLEHQRYLAKKLPQDQRGSEDYVTLTTQLLEELPKFLASVSKYFNIVVAAFANVQLLYQESVKERWEAYADEWLAQIPAGDYAAIEAAFEDQSQDVTQMLASLIKGLGASVANAGAIQSRARNARNAQRDSHPSTGSSSDNPTPVISYQTQFTPSSGPHHSESVHDYSRPLSRGSNDMSSVPPPLVRHGSSTSRHSLQAVRGTNRRRISAQSSSHLISGYFDASDSEDDGQNQVLYYAEATSSSRSNAYRSGYPVLSFMEGDQVAVELEEADSDQGGCGWLLARNSVGSLGWCRTEDFIVVD